MNPVIDKIHESELLAKLEWIAAVAGTEFSMQHGVKMDGPRNATERALLDIRSACESAEFAIKEALKQLKE